MKVVLAAATWMNPHMLVLDEPSNYLDRESLGALADAIKEFGGGVVMISHNSGESWLHAHSLSVILCMTCAACNPSFASGPLFLKS